MREGDRRAQMARNCGEIEIGSMVRSGEADMKKFSRQQKEAI